MNDLVHALEAESLRAERLATVVAAQKGTSRELEKSLAAAAMPRAPSKGSQSLKELDRLPFSIVRMESELGMWRQNASRAPGQCSLYFDHILAPPAPPAAPAPTSSTSSDSHLRQSIAKVAAVIARLN